MQFTYLNSPKRILAFACIVAALAFSIIGVTNYVQNAQGLPEIEAAVKKQLGGLSVSSSALGKLELVAKTREKTVQASDQISGLFEYAARQNGLAVEIRVNWLQDKKPCRITKVELLSSESGPVILWRDGQ